MKRFSLWLHVFQSVSPHLKKCLGGHPGAISLWWDCPDGLLHRSGCSRDRHLQGEDTALKPSRHRQSRSLSPSRPAAAKWKVTAKLLLQRLLKSSLQKFLRRCFPCSFDPFRSRKKAALQCRSSNDNPIHICCYFIMDFPRPRDPYRVWKLQLTWVIYDSSNAWVLSESTLKSIFLQGHFIW